MIQHSELHYKAIIHVNAQNISSLHRDVFLLYSKFGVDQFEFVNYFPASRAYKLYDEILAYDMNTELFEQLNYVVEKYNLEVRFTKF